MTSCPVLARSWSGGRSAPGAEGTGKGREPPATGDSNHALASEVLSQRHPETSTTDRRSSTAARATTGYPHQAAVVSRLDIARETQP